MSYFHNESLRKKLYDYIKIKINSGELKPGDPINQKEIFEELEISRTPYRDCMIQLESEGLVRIIPCRGVVVRELDTEELMEMQEEAAALEGMAYELAFYNAQKYCLRRLTELIDIAEECFKNNKIVEQEINTEYHLLILQECPNKTLYNSIKKRRERIFDFPRKDPLPIQKWEMVFWKEHKEQLHILKNGTPREFGDYTRNVHWSLRGREEYWEKLFRMKPGAISKYYETRLSAKECENN